MNKTLRMDSKDNVVTCLQPIARGDTVETDGYAVVAADDIPKFHKMAVTSIAKGSLCYKYGEIIGLATRDIHPGDHVHVHNIESTRGRGDKR